jgi:hypothetical protein
MLMHVSRVLPALVTTALLSMALASAASPTPAGVTAASAGELTGICDDLFGDVYDPASSEPLAVCQWNMDVVDADASARSRATGEGVTIGILDSGVDPTHPDIAPNLDLARSCSFIAPGTPTAEPGDDQRHRRRGRRARRDDRRAPRVHGAGLLLHRPGRGCPPLRG